jgi:hypothetical protein
MHRLSLVLFHGTLGSYVLDALEEGGAAFVACVPAPRAWAPLPSFFPSLQAVESAAFFALVAVLQWRLILNGLGTCELHITVLDDQRYCVTVDCEGFGLTQL